MAGKAREAAMRICQTFMDAKKTIDSGGQLDHNTATDPRKLLADAFTVSKAYLELCVATGREVVE